MDEKLKQLLSRYVDEHNSLADRSGNLQAHKCLYEELLDIFNGGWEKIIENKLGVSFLLTTLYSDDVYLNEFYSLIVNLKTDPETQNRFITLCKHIMDDYQNTLKELDDVNLRLFRSRYLIQSAKKVIVCLEHKLPITDSKYDIPNIKRILNYYEIMGVISNKEELLLINEIEHHNRRSLLHDNKVKNDEDYIDSLYNEIPNIINAGFQEHDVVEVSPARKSVLDDYVKTINDFINTAGTEEIINSFEGYRNYTISDIEYNYIIVKVLDYLLDKLITLYDLLVEKEVYTNYSLRADVIHEYYVLLEKYLVLHKYYDSINIFTVSEEDNVLPKEEEKVLIFAHSSKSLKSRVIDDLEDDVPAQYYEEVDDLLKRFISGDLLGREQKKLSSSKRLEKLIELRGVQVRIILRHVKDNIYCVVGVAVKKADNDMHMYNSMANRAIPNTKTDEELQREIDYGKGVLRDLNVFVKEKARKGNR